MRTILLIQTPLFLPQMPKPRAPQALSIPCWRKFGTRNMLLRWSHWHLQGRLQATSLFVTTAARNLRSRKISGLHEMMISGLHTNDQALYINVAQGNSRLHWPLRQKGLPSSTLHPNPQPPTLLLTWSSLLSGRQSRTTIWLSQPSQRSPLALLSSFLPQARILIRRLSSHPLLRMIRFI